MNTVSHRLWTKFGVAFVTIASVLTSACSINADSSPNKSVNEESWWVLKLAGTRIGHMHSVIETVDKNGKPVIKAGTVIEMKINREGQLLVVNQTMDSLETTDGDLLSFRWEMANPPAMVRTSSGTVSGGQLKLIHTVNGSATPMTEPWKVGVKSSVYQDRALKENPLKKGETRSFEYFNPEMSKIDKITFKGVDYEEVSLLNNTKRKLFKVTSAQSLLPGIVTDNYLDESGDAVKISQPVFGSTMELYRSTKAEAQQELSDEKLDLALNTMVKVKPILKGHDATRIVYKVTIDGQNPAEVIPTGDTQSIKKLNSQTAELTVTSLPIPSSAKVGEVAPEYLEKSQYLQKDDERVKKHADQASGNQTDPAEIARRMERYVQRKVEEKNLSTALASAAEVAKSLQGDCTEHSMLLAAMLRAKGIPSRVVIGFVYTERQFAFMGHMWTEAALNGQWIPLDATRGEGGISAAYIKLADASLSDKTTVFSPFTPLMTIVGRIKLDVISVD